VLIIIPYLRASFLKYKCVSDTRSPSFDTCRFNKWHWWGPALETKDVKDTHFIIYILPTGIWTTDPLSYCVIVCECVSLSSTPTIQTGRSLCKWQIWVLHTRPRSSLSLGFRGCCAQRTSLCILREDNGDLSSNHLLPAKTRKGRTAHLVLMDVSVNVHVLFECVCACSIYACVHMVCKCLWYLCMYDVWECGVCMCVVWCGVVVSVSVVCVMCVYGCVCL
jgi:hypothetical protein